MVIRFHILTTSYINLNFNLEVLIAVVTLILKVSANSTTESFAADDSDFYDVREDQDSSKPFRQQIEVIHRSINKILNREAQDRDEFEAGPSNVQSRIDTIPNALTEIEMGILRGLEEQNEKLERLSREMELRRAQQPYIPLVPYSFIPNPVENIISVQDADDRIRLEAERIRLSDEIRRLRENPAVRHCLESDCGSEFAKPLLWLSARRGAPCPKHKLCEKPVELQGFHQSGVSPRMMRAMREGDVQNQCNIMFEMQDEISRIAEELRRFDSMQGSWRHGNSEGSN